MNQSTQILRRKDLERKIGLARSTIYDKLKNDPTFPKPVKLGGPRAVGWLESEIEEWIAQQVAASRGEAAE